MTKYISILRGINVGGRRNILMADLKKLYEELGFSDILTYIQSGNVIFSANDKADTRKLAEKIEKAITNCYNFAVPVIVRTVKEMEQTIEQFFRKQVECSSNHRKPENRKTVIQLFNIATKS